MTGPLNTSLVTAPACAPRRGRGHEPSIPGHPNTPGYEVNRAMGDVAFERKLLGLWRVAQRERAYLVKRAHTEAGR